MVTRSNYEVWLDGIFCGGFNSIYDAEKYFKDAPAHATILELDDRGKLIQRTERDAYQFEFDEFHS